jgi:uncharacterized protein
MQNGGLGSLACIAVAVVWLSGICSCAAPFPPGACLQNRGDPIPATYEVTTENGFLTMSDGVRLAVTYYKPVPQSADQRFSVVLEMLPYRKDDDFYTRDYLMERYFAKRGIVLARVDIRGTGGSEGTTPDREYSDAELNDIEEVLAILAGLPWSNGNIGVQGISWGGFNAIMTAMRRPPQLKAILCAHASDDLYGNDVHYIDGGLHLDAYSVEMEVENIVPRSPDYPIDEAYFRDRFEQAPWILTYVRHQRDGEFWQTGRSLQSDWGSIAVPVYAIGALLDGYRDTVPHMLDHLSVPIHAEIGPWNHDWPHEGSPGPDYEWRDTAVRWWQQWLEGAADPSFDTTCLTVFMRGSVPPDIALEQTPGDFRAEGWPVRSAQSLRLRLGADSSLGCVALTNDVHQLAYVPSAGIQVGNWWGETTGDMRPADQNALVYDSTSLTERVRVMGSPEVVLVVASDAPLAHWVARLEDVHPDGSVSLVTGGLTNAAQRNSRTQPEPIVAGERFTLRFPLRFTTYTYEPGHRIRLVVSNAQFPMIWPTPYAMATSLYVGSNGSFLDLPTVGDGVAASLPNPVESDEEPGDSQTIDEKPLTPYRIVRDDPNGITEVTAQESSAERIRDKLYEYSSSVTHSVNNQDPSLATFRGVGWEKISFDAGRTIELNATVDIQSDASTFHARVTRQILENGTVLREKTWNEDIPRDFH